MTLLDLVILRELDDELVTVIPLKTKPDLSIVTVGDVLFVDTLILN